MNKNVDFNRVTLDEDMSNKLRMLKGRTGLSRNYLCRIALCYSLSEPQPPQPSEYDSEGQELGRHLLLGDDDPLYIAIVQERMIKEQRDIEDEFYDQFVAHINRGIGLLAGRFSDLTDFADLLPRELVSEQNGA